MNAYPDRGRFDLLAAVGEVADGSLSLEETVERMLDIVVPAFAELAALDAVDQHGDVRRLGARVAAGGPARTELEQALMRRRRPAPGVARALGSGEAELLERVTDDHLRAIAASDADYRLLRSFGVHSAIFVPLRSRGRTVGALSAATARTAPFNHGDLQFARVLSGRIALALDNAGLSEAVSGLERRLEAILRNLAEAVIVRDAQGRMVFFNEAAARLLGVASPEGMSEASADDLMALFEAFDEHGRPLMLDDLPSAKALRGERPEPLLVRSMLRGTGTERWLLHKATPVHDRDGAVSLVINVVEDLTEVKRAELGQRLLAEAGRELSRSLDYEQTLQRVAQLAVPAMADWCGVFMRGETDVLESVAVAHSDPQKAALARELAARAPTRLDEPAGAAEVLRTGRPQLVTEITDEVLDAARVPPERVRLARELRMRAAIIVPLAVADRPPIGTLSLVMGESGRTFDEEDLQLALELGRRAATAVENARLYTERSRIAATLQRSLLPPALPRVPGFDVASMYTPAGAHEVGGDFYDAFDTPAGWMLLIGDVAGRGVEAAALTSLSRYTLRAAGRLTGNPVAACEELNTALRERPELSLVSVCCVRLRSPGGGQADVVLAGHPPAIHVRGGEPRRLERFAPFLGAYPDGGWEPVTVVLDPGDLLVLYTDGVLDTVGARGERLGEERLVDALRGASSAAEVVARIERAIESFAVGLHSDDAAAVAIHRQV